MYRGPPLPLRWLRRSSPSSLIVFIARDGLAVSQFGTLHVPPPPSDFLETSALCLIPRRRRRARARASEIAIGVAGLTRFPLSFRSSDSRSCCTPLLTGVCTYVHEWSDPFGTTECFGNERSLQGRCARVFEGDPRQRRDSACCAVRRVAVDAGVEHRLRSRN